MTDAPAYVASGAGASAPGSGAHTQLAAVGAQALWLRGGMSPFLRRFRRAARFATWTDEVPLAYTPGARAQADIPKAGDLLADVHLRIALPAVPGAGAGDRWPACVGYALFRRVRLLLDELEIHNIERLWFDLYDQLHTSAGHAAGLDAMVGRTPLPKAAAHELLIPLRVLTGRKGASRPPLPLLAVPRAALRVDVDWDTVLGALGVAADPGIRVAVVCDYVELDAAERARVLRPHALAFESVIDADALSYVVDSDGDVRDLPAIKVNLSNARFAVKALVWVAYADPPGAQLFTYLPAAIEGIQVTMNNQDRTVPRPAAYYNTIQKYAHCARSPPGVPGVYSFALDATSRYPTGTADFGALAAAALLARVVPGNPRFKLKVFAVYYNFLEFGGGGSVRLAYV